MPKYPVTLSGVYDDETETLTLTGRAEPPDGPQDIPPGHWYPGEGVVISFEIRVKRLATDPTGVYIVPGSNPPEMRRVEYRNGGWQFPGTRIS